tara:strand:- start:2812 stop:3198 length:387 start_codon:yes stop_codon:yes gene_type:complete
MNPLHNMIKDIGISFDTVYGFKGTRERDGSKLDDYFTMDGSRYEFDLRLKSKDGWEQFDTNQDAGYFGVWINRDARMTVTYAEGDLTIKYDIPDMEKEYKDMCDFYGKAPAWATTIDNDGTVTKYYSR